jgi:hypothetical protein
VELLRQLMERQALRRTDDGTLSEEQIERLILSTYLGHRTREHLLVSARRPGVDERSS